MKRKSKQHSTYKPASKDFDYSQSPFYWLMQLSNRYTQQMEKKLKKVGLNITGWRVGMILHIHGSLSVTEITTHAGARMPTITKLVYKMRDQGLVTIRPSEGDGRVSIVAITEEGTAIIESAIKDTSKLYDSAYEGLTISEVKNVNKALRTILTNISND
ncbi:MarR family winged helix-turn-helix transcriptional regulator [Dasania marina]|uniref:MarR family winged helix-turn-helix transcriptional regulator n=1 Tax=Dasania marina TaxID=471499 RepID=UPI000382B4E1|nr:MarR family transcriptional regulator [Dasania marina]